MASNGLSLDDHQRFTLMKFKRNVSDVIQPHHNEKFLLRWLRARSWNVEAAEKMLRQSLKWRKQWEVDEGLKTWQPPENLIPYYPCGTTGYDKTGAPVIIVPFGNLDIVGLLHAFGRQIFVKMTIQMLEKYMQLAAEKSGHKIVVIFDMEGFNLRQYVWRPAGEVVISMVRMYEANYPEILRACFIINAPPVFAIAFNVVKRFLNEYTLGKMQIFKNDPKKWKKVLLENIEAENLPEHYGGTLKDADGNPHYTTKVVQGGKVPRHLYKRHYEQNSDTLPAKQYTTLVIKKGDKLSLDFVATEEGSFLKWDFRTEEHDIRFGITMKDADGNITPVIDHKRVAAHQVDEAGVIACQAQATYTVTFDNSYSLLRSKKVQYDIGITPPLEKLHILDQHEILGDEVAEVAATSTES
ncbi:SEC14-like protein 3 [Zophobas morio]|uniref:SEC14-like protein 3 n=1 Tax=Zophobas morio TaxID=2755281 RepID=UPI0030831FD4